MTTVGPHCSRLLAEPLLQSEKSEWANTCSSPSAANAFPSAWLSPVKTQVPFVNNPGKYSYNTHLNDP